MPCINAAENIRHDPRDMQTMDWNIISPLDEQVVCSMRECEAVFMRMMDRHEWMGMSYSYEERKRRYLMLLRYWNHVVNDKKINLFLSSTIPHRIRTYLIYHLCKTKGIKTIFTYHTGHLIEDFLISEDIYDFSPEIEERVKQLNMKYKNNNDPVELPKNYEDYIKSQTIGGCVLPNYWYTNIGLVPEQEHGKFVMAVKFFKSDRTKFFRQVSSSLSARCKMHYWIRRIKHLFRIVRARRIFRYYTSNAIEPNFSEKYVYLPLHLQPECTTCPMSGVYADQLLMAQMLSEVLPDDVYVYVKEHPNQQKTFPDGKERSIDFYKDLLHCPRVRFIKCSVNTYRLIDNSIAVATGIGTAGVEAVFRGKPFLMFGHWSYQYAPGAFSIRTVEDCIKAIYEIINVGVKPELRDIRIFLKSLADVSFQGLIDERIATYNPEYEKQSVKAFSSAFIQRIHKYFHTSFQ